MMLRTSKHSVTATSSGGLAFSVSIRDHLVSTDQPSRAGGDDTAPTPLELLSASLAGCIALYVHKFCEANSLAASGFAVEVKPLWKEEPGRIARFDVIVHVPDTIPAMHHAAIEEVARTCPVHNTLTHMPEITVQLRELASVGASGGPEPAGVRDERSRRSPDEDAAIARQPLQLTAPLLHGAVGTPTEERS